MTTPNSEIPDYVLTALQCSGFPFQTAVQHFINSSNGWTLHTSEYPWQTSHGDEQFLDLVAIKEGLFLTIECKKTRKDSFTFLLPLGLSNTGAVEEFRRLYAKQGSKESNKLEVFCGERAFLPGSTVSEFCVVSTSESEKDQRLLERDAGLIVHGTEAFAQDFQQRFRHECDPASLAEHFFVPVIVTNAPIYIARYKPPDVSLESGEFSVTPSDIKKVAWVRFRKAFTSDRGPDLGHRSVFVVHAASFGEFLEQVKLAPTQPANTAAVHFICRQLR